jgi:hypothetical protein
MKTVIEMAEEVGAYIAELPLENAVLFEVDILSGRSAKLEAFAELVRAEALAQPVQRQPLTDELYNELLFAVGNKYPNETRHQTALRYIKDAETCHTQLAKAIIGAKP